MCILLFRVLAAPLLDHGGHVLVDLIPDLGLHSALDLLSAAVEPADIEPCHLAMAVGLQCLGHLVTVAILVGQTDDAGLVQTHDLALHANVDRPQRLDELVH